MGRGPFCIQPSQTTHSGDLGVMCLLGCPVRSRVTNSSYPFPFLDPGCSLTPSFSRRGGIF